MMSCVIDLYPWRSAPQSLSHPAGVSLPLDDPGHADFLIPQLRHAISTGRHCADLVGALADAAQTGDRVLVIGSGLGVLSTLVAKLRGVEKVIAMEPNVSLAAYIETVHKVNGVPWVETVNAVPAADGGGRVPLFVRHDVRSSSLDPEDGPWRQVMLVPGMDLGLILVEERISLVIAEGSMIPAGAAADLRLGSAVRALLGFPQAIEDPCADAGVAGMLAARAGAVERFGTALMFSGKPARRSAGRVARAR